ncbi:restriction endonuclease subunit S [Hyphomonas sp.]|uniref:restriction endonuclease subunit S n=1 Tax=Hyphomonas sp. TaxID=87 RepID=UPI0032EE54BF
MGEWNTVVLENLLVENRGISVGVMYPGTNTSDGIPLIRVGDIVHGRVVADPTYRISPNVHHEYRRTELEGGECLVTLVGRPGVAVPVPKSMAGWNAARALAVIRLKNPDDLNFFVYAMASPKVQHRILNLCNTTVQPTLNLKEIKTLELPWPDQEMRDEIANLLSAIDDKIELNRRTNETLEAMAQATFKDWFVDFGPVRRKMQGEADAIAILGGLIDDPDRATSLAALFPDTLGDNGLPEGWREQPFSYFVEIMGGGTPKTSIEEYWGGQVPWYSVVDTPSGSDVFVFETQKTITPSGEKNSSARLVPPGTTIISARGTVGNLAMAAVEMTFNQSCYGLLPSNGTGPTYVYLATQHVVHRLQQMAHGSVFSTITRQTFDNAHLAASRHQIFEAFETIVAPLFAKIKSNVHENQTLAETRDYLLPKLMSGEIRAGLAEELVA